MNLRRLRPSGSVTLCLVALIGARPCIAASIERAGEIEGFPVITVDGEMKLSDVGAFQSLADRHPRAIVAFRSNGGELRAGLGLGTIIREKGFRTFVPSESRCASACALAWLAGSPRIAGSGAQIGFHAAYRLEDGKASETGAGNALVGAYLNRLALSDRAVVFITQAPPASLNWLTPARAASLEIPVETSSTHLDKMTAGDALFGRPGEAKPAVAESSKPEQASFRSVYSNWRLYVGGTPTRKTCHLVAAPAGPSVAGVSVTISRRPAENVPHELAVSAEAPLRQGPGGEIRVDGASYPLNVRGRNAWPRRADEAEMMAHLSRAAAFTAVLQSSSGERIEQRYSLDGLALALGRASAECP
jgi:hypothetical protein